MSLQGLKVHLRAIHDQLKESGDIAGKNSVYAGFALLGLRTAFTTGALAILLEGGAVVFLVGGAVVYVAYAHHTGSTWDFKKPTP